MKTVFWLLLIAGLTLSGWQCVSTSSVTDRQINSFDDCAAAGLPIMESYPRQCQTPDGRNFTEQIAKPVDTEAAPEIIGGQRDEHGCLNPAGYGWDAEITACVRSWELDADQRRAAQIAAQSASGQYGLTVIAVESINGEAGSYLVKMETNGEQRESLEVTIINWTIQK